MSLMTRRPQTRDPASTSCLDLALADVDVELVAVGDGDLDLVRAALAGRRRRAIRPGREGGRRRLSSRRASDRHLLDPERRAAVRDRDVLAVLAAGPGLEPELEVGADHVDLLQDVDVRADEGRLLDRAPSACRPR